MNVKTMSIPELYKSKEEAEKQFCGFRECLNSLDIKDLLPKEGIKIPEKGNTPTTQDIQEAIRKIASK